jgi:type IV secretion system protein VirB9
MSPTYAQAVVIPKGTPQDARVREVIYDPANVVKVIAHFGYQIFVQFADNETIMDLGSGDTEAWSIGVIKAKNGFFIKPRGDRGSTNLTVITDRHHYNFDLILHEGKGTPSYYMVKFLYPGDAEKKSIQEAEKDKADRLLREEASNPENKPYNRNYWWDGSESLKPTAAWDNGTFTYFRYGPGRDFPAVFTLNEEDPEIEATVNIHVEGDTLVVHKIAERFILRLGNKAAGIWNKSFLPYGRDLPGKTLSPVVTRTIKSGDAQ